MFGFLLRFFPLLFCISLIFKAFGFFINCFSFTDTSSFVDSSGCPFFDKGICPYSLKKYDEDWCYKYCQMFDFEED